MSNQPFNGFSRSVDLPAGVWRASQQNTMTARTTQTGHPTLARWLPNGGWPLGSLIEVLTQAPGCGELGLVAPALRLLPSKRPIALLNPPGVPNVSAWQQWEIPHQRLWWLEAKTLHDRWWSAETVLRSQAFAALLAWLDPIDDNALRRLHACAQDSNTLLFIFRPQSTAKHFSPGPLRLLLTADQSSELTITILKSKGSKPAAPIVLAPKPMRTKTSGEVLHVDGHRSLVLQK